METVSHVPRRQRQIKVNAMAFGRLVRFLLEGEYTVDQLAELTGLHQVTVYQYTREMHRAGAAHICEWREDSRGRQIIKIYKIGHARDARRLRMSASERQARYRARKKSRLLEHAT